MDILASSSHLDLAEILANDPTTFLFMSEHRKVRTSGAIAHITARAEGGVDKDSPLQMAVAEAFQRARELGQKNPIVIGAIPFDVSQPSALTVPEWYEFMPHMAVNTNQSVKLEPLTVSEYRYQPNHSDFKNMISEAVQRLKQGQLEKVVLSRILELDLSQAVDCNAILQNLIVQNPAVYQFRIPLGNNNTLIGASPELLVRKQKNSITTNPLAGTCKRMADPQQDHLNAQRLWQSTKDQHEHRLVIDTLRTQLSPLCDQLDIPAQPELIQTSNLWHLSTRIQATLKEPATNALQIACLLHPTPALCGSPAVTAKQLIDELEPHDRGLFSGIVGWCDSEGNGEWAVTIRCGLVQAKRIRLFAGAGIVADSDPESEWQETGAKLGTMLNAFNIHNGE
ncbi:isochorismate synthase [Gynuella sunshinyii]|uniref:isochorismate synthase n=1 Tax=Gynuella sunshinyii YC6258 TaxID=1445510 RepID=A0A0C5VJJ3_9GAMM|nr:isochorismate synthase MenF [Gynuella sunshinyii]AJQ94807.1 isochorismate synthase [Gynuella sunshinyii YC6258]